MKFTEFILRSGAGIVFFIEREAGHTVVGILLVAAAVLIVDPNNRVELGKNLAAFALGMLSRGMGEQKAKTQTQ